MFCINNHCSLCQALNDNNVVLKKTNNFTIMFNAFPYTPGAIMIVLNSHVDNNLLCLNNDLRYELIELTAKCQDILTNLGCGNFNIGVNSGPLSGASIPHHFHLHIVPRTENDTGFFQTIANNSTLTNKNSQLYIDIRYAFYHTLF